MIFFCFCECVALDVSNVACRLLWYFPFKVFGDLDGVGLGSNLDVLAAKADCCYEEVSRV